MRLIDGVWRGAVVSAGALAMLAMLACGSPKENATPRAAVGVESTTDSGRPATQTTAKPRVLFLGTSLTAGLGLDPDSAYPAVVQRLAARDSAALDVINAGLSGETSAGALRRADWLLTQPLSLIVIETGANDGLRGLQPDSTAANIESLIAKARAAQPAAAIALMQMEAPTNLGPAYQKRFRAIFPTVAAKSRVRLLPFLLEGVAGHEDLNQDDGIHPTGRGAQIVAATVYRGLKPVIDSLGRR